MRDDKENAGLMQLQEGYFAATGKLITLLTKLRSYKKRIREVGQDLLNPVLSLEMVEHKRAHIALLEQELSPLTEEINRENHKLALFNQGIEQLLAVMQPFVGVANTNPEDVTRALQSIGLLTNQPRAAESAEQDEVKDDGMRKT